MAEMSLNQQIVKEDVDHAAGQVGRHGQLGVAAPPLGGIDDHRDHVKEHAAHDNLEVGHRRLMRIRVAARQFHHPRSKGHKQYRYHHSGDTGQDNRRQQDLVGRILAFFSLAPGHQGGNRHIDAKEDRQSDELGLVSRPTAAMA